jgi:hypothetical protein
VQITAPNRRSSELFSFTFPALARSRSGTSAVSSNPAQNLGFVARKVADRNTSSALLHDPDGYARSSNDTLYWTLCVLIAVAGALGRRLVL